MISLCVFPSKLALLAVAVPFLLIPTAARADLILNVNPASLGANPGDTVTFTGTITNTTGVTLNGTDMFLNFGGFDPSALIDFTQILGTPDFVLLDHHITPIIDLFSVTVAPTVQAGNYSFDVSLLDINNNSSDTLSAAVQVGGSSAVPEPSSVLLLATGALGIILIALVRRPRIFRGSGQTVGFRFVIKG
jgi:hypothetical protein